jgi:hypothetical protein
VLLPPGTAYEGVCNGETYEIWGVVSGSVELFPPGGGRRALDAVEWTLLPADLGPYALRTASVGGPGHAASDSGAGEDALLLHVFSPQPD